MWRDLRSLLENDTFWKKNYYESFRFASTLREKIFSRATVNCFSMAQITQILFLFGMPPLERSKITVWERHLFQKKKTCYGSFAFMPTLRKKVFSRARVKCFSLYGSNKSYSFVFGNAASGEIKDNSLRMTPSPKTFFRRKFWVCVYISFCCFCEYRFCRDQRSQFLQYRFSKYFWTMKLFLEI